MQPVSQFSLSLRRWIQASPDLQDKMIKACEDKRPAIENIQQEIHTRFGDLTPPQKTAVGVVISNFLETRGYTSKEGTKLHVRPINGIRIVHTARTYVKKPQFPIALSMVKTEPDVPAELKSASFSRWLTEKEV